MLRREKDVNPPGGQIPKITFMDERIPGGKADPRLKIWSAPNIPAEYQPGAEGKSLKSIKFEDRCLVCYKELSQEEIDLTLCRESTGSGSDLVEIRKGLFQAFYIEVADSYFDHVEGGIPLCTPCITKCKEMRAIGLELEAIQKKYDDIRDEIAHSIVYLVDRTGGVRKAEYDMKMSLPPEGDSIYNKVRYYEVEILQQSIWKGWGPRFPDYTDLNLPEGFPYWTEDEQDPVPISPSDVRKKFGIPEPVIRKFKQLKPSESNVAGSSGSRPQQTKATAVVKKSETTTAATTTKSSNSAGKTTIISITTRDEKPTTSAGSALVTSSRKRPRTDSSDSSSSPTSDPSPLEFEFNNRQITITNEKGAVVNNSSLRLSLGKNGKGARLLKNGLHATQIHKTKTTPPTPDKDEDDANEFLTSTSGQDLQDYLHYDSEEDLDESDLLEAEYEDGNGGGMDMEDFLTPQLNLSAELLNYGGDKQPMMKKKKLDVPHDLEITEWSGGARGSDDAEQRMMMEMEYDHLIEEEGLDDMTLEELEEGMSSGRRNGRSGSTSSDGQGSLNVEDYQQNEEGLYVCAYCQKTFIHKYPFRDHLKTHTGEGPRCNICNKIFPKSHNLMLHMRTHTGEKPYKCDVCRKGFADKSNLKVHMRVHTGERPYKCEYCDLAFVNSSRLVVHRRLHTGEKPFPCEVCGRTFTTSNQLLSHKKIHFTGKPYPCEHCGKGYSNLSSLTAHMTHFHGITTTSP